jgi:hypothetical protein
LSNQPLVSPVEVAALRSENASLRKQLEDQKVFFEAQITELTKQRDVAEGSLKVRFLFVGHSARPLNFTLETYEIFSPNGA